MTTERIDPLAAINPDRYPLNTEQRNRMAAAHKAVAELVEAANGYAVPLHGDPNIGWCGFASDSAKFRCESCGVEHFDTALMDHARDCAAMRLIAALAPFGRQG